MKKITFPILGIIMLILTIQTANALYNETFDDSSWESNGFWNVTSEGGAYTTEGGYLKITADDVYLVFNVTVGIAENEKVCMRISNSGTDMDATNRIGLSAMFEPGCTNDYTDVRYTSDCEVWAINSDYNGGGSQLLRHAKSTDWEYAGLGNDGWNVICYEWDNTNIVSELNGVDELTNTLGNIYGTYYSGGWQFGGTQPNYNTGFKWVLWVTDAACAPTWIDWISFETYSIVTPSTLFTLNASSIYNQTEILTFNATVNETFYTTTNGTIVTTISNNTQAEVNITINATGFDQLTATNWNVTNTNYWANMTGITITDITPDIEETTGIYVGETINVSCTYTNNTGLTTTQTNYLYNLNDTTLLINYNTTSSYTLLITDWMDYINYTCRICTQYYCQNDSTYINDDEIDARVTFSIYNYLDALISSTETIMPTYSITEYNNPFTQLLSTFLTQNNKSMPITVNITDLTYMNRDYNNASYIINESQTFNFTLDPNELTITFSETTEGLIRDEEKAMNFSNSSIVVVQQNLTDGYVKVLFNINGEGNWTQYYEYINTNYLHVSETIEILGTDADTISYIRLLDEGNNVIPDVVIRAYTVEPTDYPLYTDHDFMGQRLTDEEGYTFFVFNDNSTVVLVYTANGYETKTQIIIPSDLGATTRDNAHVVRLDESSSYTDFTMTVYIQNVFYTRNSNILGTIFAPNRDQVAITTTYAQSLGLNNTILTADSLDRYDITLIPNTHFSNTTTDNITLLIYDNGVNWRNITITYDTGETNEILTTSTFTALSQPILAIMLAIALITISTIIGFMIPNGTSGHTTFMTGGLILSLISIQFWMLTVICLTYWTLRMIQGVIKE